jgi:multiple sugar transport system substrate-binding protein
MKRTRFSSIVMSTLLVLVLLLGACQSAPATQATSNEPVKLVVLTHWGEESLATPMKALLDEYTKANPNVTIEYQAVTFDQLLTKISTSRAAGTAPDIIHIYNLWMPDFVKGGALATPPADVVEDIKANYSPGSIQAVTVKDQIWGYPTEINTWQLVYNKKMFADAGLSEPPKTLDELKDYACKLTKKKADGTLEHTGLAVLTGWDSGVVHPFLSLLWSNGGEYLAADHSKSEFNSPQGKEVLQAYSDMIKQGCVDPGLGGGFNDFVTGKSAMVIMANFFRSDLKNSFVDGYDNVGVAPIPVGPSGDKSVALQYNWLWTVDKTSKNAEAAWKLVKWLNSPRAEGKASPMGEYLTSALGAIPSRLSDQKALSDTLSDFFLKAYLDSASTSQPEPVLVGGQEIKTALQTQIENTWYDKASIDEALQSAATEADRILSENK